MEIEAETESMAHLSDNKGQGESLASMPSVGKKSQYAVMSSSLKERLKKCGRYHPATPPSPQQTTPFPSQRRTHSSVLHHSSMPSEHSPISHQKVNYVQPVESFKVIRKTLPLPRNIWTGKFNLENGCGMNPTLQTSHNSVEVECEDGGMHVSDDDSSNVMTSKKASNVCGNATATCDIKTKDSDIHIKQEIKGDQTCISPERGLSEGIIDNCVKLSKELPESDNSAYLRNTKNSAYLSATSDVDKHLLSTLCRTRSKMDCLRVTKKCSTDVLKQCDRPYELTSKELITFKKQLQTELTAGKEVVRKLNMVKTYRAKNNLHHLQGLIEKWRSVCQNAVLDLYRMTPDPQPSVTQLMRQLGIDEKLIRYNHVEESFDAP